MELLKNLFPASKSDMTNDEKSLAQYIRSKVDEVRASPGRISHESIWMTNCAYTLGFDGVVFDTALRQFRPSNQAAPYLRRNRLHANKILPALQNRTSRLCKNQVRWDVRPESSDTDDKEATRLGKQALDYWWDKERLNQRRISLLMWMQQCGLAYGKVVWDTNAGKPMVDPETGELSYEGDVCFEIVPPFEIFPDPVAKTLEDAAWVIHAKVRKLDYFRSHYPEKGPLVEQEDAWLLSLQYENRLNSVNAVSGNALSQQKPLAGAAIELCYYEKRSKKYPNGRMCVTANGILLEDKELPVGEFPIVKFDDVVIGGKFYSESLVTHARPLQDQYNRVLNMRADWTNKLLAGKYLVPKGAGINAEGFNDRSGEILEYTPQPNGQMPQALQIPQLPQYAYTETVELERQINEIFGIGEISKGQLPSASIPYAGMAFLQEQDETRIGIVTENLEHAWCQVLRLALMYIGKFYEMPRMIKISGKNQEYIVKSFTGQDLKDNFDVFVIRGSTVPGSKVLKRQEIIALHAQGYLGDPADPKVREKVLDMLEYGDVAEAWVDHGIDQAQIQKDIKGMEQGVQPLVHELDNHELHIQEKNRYRKTDKFEKLDPQLQAVFEQNIEAHIQSLTKMVNPGMAMQDQMKPQLEQIQNQIAQDPTSFEPAIREPNKNPMSSQGAL